MSSLGDSGKKRKYVELTKEDYEDIFTPTQDEKDRDRSIADYFNVTKHEATMRTLETTMKTPAFAELSEEVQLQVQAKYEASVKEFMNSYFIK